MFRGRVIILIALVWVTLIAPWWFVTTTVVYQGQGITGQTFSIFSQVSVYMFPWGSYYKVYVLSQEGWLPFFQFIFLQRYGAISTTVTILIGVLETIRFAILLTVALGVTRQFISGRGQQVSVLKWTILLFVVIVVFAVGQLLDSLFPIVSRIPNVVLFYPPPPLIGSFHIGFYTAIATLATLVYTFYASATERLRENAKELARSNVELEQFAYLASHDLQEPLRMVASYTQLLAKRNKGKLDSESDEFIDYAVDGATRMQRLIEDLLTYSRVGRQHKPPEPTNCNAVLDTAFLNLRGAIDESGATITRDPLPTVMCNATQLGQVFQNLIGNALKFRGKEPPRVHVSAERKEKEWVFSVRDNGIGIDPKYGERLFGLFQRLHGAEYPGTGIGLAICKKIVERHGGRIWMESQPGQGSTFYFTVPTT